VRLVYLSHPLAEDTPAYGGGPSLVIEHARSIQRGDTANAAVWTLSNHLGTHLDFPRHFVRDGKCLDDYPVPFFAFARVVLVDVSGAGPGTVIGPDAFETIPPDPDADMILALTGMGRLRATRDYWEKNPVFEPRLADAVRRRYPRVRVFGFDAISLSSWSDRETGRAAHRAFLEGDRPILLLEDMDLSPLAAGSSIGRLVVSPLRVAGTDAAPATVIAEVEP
jgi:arylformamidase